MDTANVCIKVLEPSEEDEVVEVSVKKQKENLLRSIRNLKRIMEDEYVQSRAS
jgi:hypothetical protein